MFAILTAPIAASALPAFPGAEGHGSTTPGGRGGRVIEVTNLNDSGPGSLRAALESAGKRIVVFRTGGTITLKSLLKIEDPFITVAGQTAPGDGIMVRGGGFRVKAHDVIIRGMRFRPGDTEYGVDADSMDGITVCCNTNPDPYNVIVDHCSFSWSPDGNMAIGVQSHDITFSYNITGEALHDSINATTSGHGIVLTDDGLSNISIHHNLIANNRIRNPQLSDNGDGEFINNLIYNWEGMAGRVKSNTKSSWIGNYWKAGPHSNKSSKGIEILSETNTFLYVEGNIGPQRPEDTGSDWLCVEDDPDESTRVTSPPLPLSGITVQSAEAAYQDVMKNVGAIPRDKVDTQIINDLINGTGHMISCVVANTHPSNNSLCDDQSEYYDAKAWPSYDPGSAPADTDHDGMPDGWEMAQGLNPNDSSDGNKDRNGDGYTNIEEYINGFLTTGSNAGNDPPPTPGDGGDDGDGTGNTFTAVADASVNSAEPNTNFGAGTALEVDGSPTKITYLRFNVAGLNGGVQSARLRLSVSDPSAIGGTIHALSDDGWKENAVTYNNRPSIDGQALDSLGAVSTGNSIELDVTSAISGNGTYCFAITSDNSNGADYGSREDPNNPPALIVTANGAGDPAPQSPTALRIQN
jgi:pectate lyase